jgi:exopolyphosphatase/guanosine-5'-triphosphate,3'-diphosphate pyrophosphatase
LDRLPVGRNRGSTLSEPLFPLRVGCVDAGSNAIRFLIAEFSDPSSYETLHYERVPVRLGHQVFLDGQLDPQAIDAAVNAFRVFREHLDELEVEHHRAVATSAVREARNGSVLVDRVFQEARIELEVISGSEEARLVHTAVASRVDLTRGQWILVDLGGGSVEVSLVDDMGMLWTESHTMGSVRLLEVLSGPDDDRERFQTLLREYVGILRIPAPAQYWEPSGFVATGGNIDALASLAAAPADESGVQHLPLSDLESSIELLSRLSYRDRIDKLQMREDRADVILPASLVYRRLARLAEVDEILVPNVGVKDGILLDLVDDLVSHSQHLERGEAQVCKAAISLGRRFLFDEAHATHVADLARSLFDQLAPIHRLPPRTRVVLVAAALLHDIGAFIHQKSHHKHALYVIARSDLPGMSPQDMQVAANVARYHRGAHPQPGHSAFVSLTSKHKARVRQLASLLRLADAMDRQQRQRVYAVRTDIEGRTVTLHLEGEGDLLLERWAIAKKKGLFEETFGYSVAVSG